jgi:HAD superfamily hydrolase (TIGR01549 family)
MTRPKKPRALVFDLDGTLVDSLALVLRAIAHGIEPFGAIPTMDIFAKLGGPPERFMPSLVRDLRHVPEAIRRMDAFHRENWHTIQPFDGIVHALGRLRDGGVRLAIWTGRDRESGSRLLRELRLEAFFATIVFGDDLPTHKPDPEGLREIMRRLEVTAEETIFIGDADVDVLGGAGCGVDTILIRHAREIEEHVRLKSWRHVATPREAVELVLALLP